MFSVNNIALLFILCLASHRGGSIFDEQDMDPCKEADYHYELTECDAQNGRWRVQVPSSGICADTNPNPATRINNCRISCDAGYYYDLSDLTCRMCRPGTYSLGGGIHFESWRQLPAGFHTQVESFHSSFSSIGRLNSEVNCSRFGWQLQVDFLASQGGPCAATLTYTVHLVKPGNLTYVYQYSDKDIIFDFEAQNEQCHSIGDSKEYRWPSSTREGEWKQQTVRLKTGQNVLQWKTIGMDLQKRRPVLIKTIEISGVAFTSSCTPCRAGTYSLGGARQCTECPGNHYSLHEASSCTPCNNVTEFAPNASPACLKRQPCTLKDYYESRTPCDSNNQTQHIYKWLQPKICRDDVPDAVCLPPASPKQVCPPCNPGMDYQNGSNCEFCPLETYSDGKTGCKRCPPNTTPNYGYTLHLWNEIPKVMNSACIEPDGSQCSSTMSWQVAGSYIHSSRHHPPTAYLLLSLGVGGFRTAGRVSGGRRLEVGRISFSFELDCQGKCEFVFMQGSEKKGVVLVQSWTGSHDREDFTHIILQNDSYTFSWAFQKMELGTNLLDAKVDDDNAKIFSINITNTIDGGAVLCLPCHQEQDETEQGCIPCPPGHYVEPNTTACIHCPPNSTVADPFAYGIESCESCGPGLSSINGITCSTDCVFDVDDIHYDLRTLASPLLVKGSRLFTASGAQYYHLFNISLCGLSAAMCNNNVSYQMEGQSTEVKSFVCRSTIVPSQWTEDDFTLVTQSVTLGDELVAVTKYTTYLDIAVIDEFVSNEKQDLHFYYSTSMATRSCPQGRTTVVTLRCDTSETVNGTVLLPNKCPDGTCDGCNFNFLWTSSVACPMCREKEFRLVKGECVNGVQMIHYLPPTNCIMPVSIPSVKYAVCTTTVPRILKIVIAVTMTLLIFLCILMLYFWRKTQNLEYKYMKLVQSAGGRDTDVDGEGETEGALAHAESCALDDGEEEEIQFSEPRGTGIINRIRAMTVKSETGNPFETIQLTK